MRRSPAVVATLVALALTVAACGGSSNSADSSSSADMSAPANGSGDAAGILSAIDTKASTGPQKLKLDVNVDIKGTPANQQLALFTKQPIHLGLDGVIDSTGKSADVNVSVTLGKSPLEAEIRTGGGKSWIQIDGKWYDLPANIALVDDRFVAAGRRFDEQSRCGQDSRRDRGSREAPGQCLGFERHGRRYRYGQSVGRCQHRGRCGRCRKSLEEPGRQHGNRSFAGRDRQDRDAVEEDRQQGARGRVGRKERPQGAPGGIHARRRHG